MDLLNIGAGNKDDAFYRYKMPKMITKIEGRGNGIKTNIVNMVDIAKALGRPASYTTKYFGCELGAQSKFDDKTGTSHVNGSHDNAKLAALLEVFIKKYVQCYGCGNPETEIMITKSQMINLNCVACGYISNVDMRDKLTTFILKNPPEQKKGSKDKKAMRRAEKERLKEGEMADEEQKKHKKEKKKSIGGSSKDGGASKASGKKKANFSDEDHSPLGSLGDEDEATCTDDSDDNVQWQTDTSMEAARQRIQEQLSTVTAGMVMLSTNEEESTSGANSPARDKRSKLNGGLKSVKSRDRLDKIKDDRKVNGLKSVRSHGRLDKIKDLGLKSVRSHDRLDKMKDHGLKSVRSHDRLDKIKDHGLKKVRSHDRLNTIKDDEHMNGLKSGPSSERLDKIKDDDGQANGQKSVYSHERLVAEIKDYLKEGSPAAGQLKSFLGSLSGTHQEIVDSLFEALFNEIGKGFSKEVVKKKNYLAVATREEGSQLMLLHAVESFSEKANPDAAKEVALVLKALYDNDVVEEEFILEWYEKGMKGSNKDSPVWQNVKPFVEWLKSAESESEEE